MEASAGFRFFIREKQIQKKFLSSSVALGEEAGPEIAGRSVYETRARKDS